MNARRYSAGHVPDEAGLLNSMLGKNVFGFYGLGDRDRFASTVRDSNVDRVSSVDSRLWLEAAN